MSVETGSPALGFLLAALGGAVLSLLFALLTQYALANQVASGLALTLFGLGLSSLMGQGYVGIKPPPTPKLDIPVLSDLPFIGRVVFSHDLMVYFALALVAAVWATLKYTRAGLVLRAVGENHDAAHALGYKVVRVRLMAILFGGACAGLGGAYISLVRVPQWTEGMTAGAGWIALALVVFASWKAGRVLLGAWLFGRGHGAAAQPAGRGGRHPGGVSFDVALLDHHRRAGHHVGGQIARARIAGPRLPRLGLRRYTEP